MTKAIVSRSKVRGIARDLRENVYALQELRRAFARGEDLSSLPTCMATRLRWLSETIDALDPAGKR
mgnify:CR=1 FL=1